MKSTLRDSLLTGAALITILGCGFGLGRLSPRESVPPAPSTKVESMAQDVLKSLRQSLDLSEKQEAEIAPELNQLSQDILDSRDQALLRYYRELINFHDLIAPKLTPRQQGLLKANKELLEKEFASRFPSGV